jgi:hypothetical protein
MRVLKNGALDPFTLARVCRIQMRAERTKVALRARHADGPEDYLNARQPRLVRGAYPHEYEPPVPVAVRRLALRANHLARKFQARRRAHRPTGHPRGPRRDDQAIAREVRWYESDYLMSRIEAMRSLAGAIAAAERIEVKSAMARVRRALRRPD